MYLFINYDQTNSDEYQHEDKKPESTEFDDIAYRLGDIQIVSLFFIKILS